MTTKYFTRLLSISVLSTLLAGQYGYLAIDDIWYTTYAILTCIDIASTLLVIFLLPRISTNMTPEEKQLFLPITQSPIILVTVPSGLLVLLNAGFLITAIISAISTIALLVTVNRFKSNISNSK